MEIILNYLIKFVNPFYPAYHTRRVVIRVKFKCVIVTGTILLVFGIIKFILHYMNDINIYIYII